MTITVGTTVWRPALDVAPRSPKFGAVQAILTVGVGTAGFTIQGSSLDQNIVFPAGATLALVTWQGDGETYQSVERMDTLPNTISGLYEVTAIPPPSSYQPGVQVNISRARLETAATASGRAGLRAALTNELLAPLRVPDSAFNNMAESDPAANLSLDEIVERANYIQRPAIIVKSWRQIISEEPDVFTDWIRVKFIIDRDPKSSNVEAQYSNWDEMTIIAGAAEVSVPFPDIEE